MPLQYNPNQAILLSIQQPWAWLIVKGYKDVENRTWPTRYRGPFLVHAGQKFDPEGFAWVHERFPEIEMPAPEAFERGGVVGLATLANCFAPGALSVASPWYAGQYAFVLTNARPLPFRPCRGKLGFFKEARPQ